MDWTPPIEFDALITNDSPAIKNKHRLEFGLNVVAEQLGLRYGDIYGLVIDSALGPHFLPGARNRCRMRAYDLLLLFYAGLLKEHGVTMPRVAEHIAVLQQGLLAYLTQRQNGNRHPDVWMVLFSDPSKDELVCGRDGVSSHRAVFEIRISVDALFERAKGVYQQIITPAVRPLWPIVRRQQAVN